MSRLDYHLPQPTESGFDRPFAVLAMLTALATFPLIFMGGLVTSRHAGMSVPDWPNSYGYNMFLFPPRLWVGGILYEHTHRLMGTLVGFLSLLLAAMGLRPRVDRRLRILGFAVLGMVILQGVLGGLRVVMVKLDLAIVHACVAQAFFCLAAFTAFRASRWWASASPAERVDPKLLALAITTVIAIYLQLIVGAEMRHHDAGLAIPDLPLAYGRLIPPVNGAQLATVNHDRVWRLNLDPVTLGQVWIHFAHRVGALVVSGLVISLVTLCLRRNIFRRAAATLITLLLAQLSLGVLTVVYRKPADVASAHVAVGALLLVTTWLLLIAVFHLLPEPTRQAAAVSSSPDRTPNLELAPA